MANGHGSNKGNDVKEQNTSYDILANPCGCNTMSEGFKEAVAFVATAARAFTPSEKPKEQRQEWLLALVLPTQLVRTLSTEGDVRLPLSRLLLEASYFYFAAYSDPLEQLRWQGEAYTALPELQNSQQQVDCLLVVRVVSSSIGQLPQNGIALQYVLDDAESAFVLGSHGLPDSSLIMDNKFLRNL